MVVFYRLMCVFIEVVSNIWSVSIGLYREWGKSERGLRHSRLRFNTMTKN